MNRPRGWVVAILSSGLLKIPGCYEPQILRTMLTLETQQLPFHSSALGCRAVLAGGVWGVLKGKATLRVPPPVPSTLLSPPFSLPSPLAGQGPGSGG